MIGLSYLLFFVLYVWLWRWAVRRTRAWAVDTGHNPRHWAWVAHIGMYSLVFWDLIPTHALHRYYCATEGGFKQYQTLDQWKTNNPRVAAKLTPIEHPKWQTKGNRTRVPLNQRFAWDIVTTLHPLHIRERDERIVDVQTGEVMARYVDFDTDIPNQFGVQRGLRDYKAWLGASSCELGERMKEKIKFNGFSSNIERLGK